MQIAVFISSIDVVKPGWLLKYLKGIRPAHIKAMQQNLAKVCNQGHVEFNSLLPSAPLHFLYSSPDQPLGPEDLVWKMMVGKVVNIKLHTRRSQRVVEGSRSQCTCECRSGKITNTASIIS
ncbi:hypothetical protein GYH30_017984 [Glycine max]|uniref:Uncharacterized protein n=2 Tax=Glycine subgen. Soja TaxID=1462606 RepID=K7L0W5_SOYBN|nr:hypothetical protein GYH30_017984 [Glycine max]RZC02338.1 hypothetical protein D0Y65_017460 [Glycine soja]